MTKFFLLSQTNLLKTSLHKALTFLAFHKDANCILAICTIIELTALHNPCVQIENFQTGMLKEVISKDEHGKIIRKLGVMGVVSSGGQVQPNDEITIQLPAQPHKNLEYVW